MVGPALAAARAGQPSGVAALIDQTLLTPAATRKELESLCDGAREWGFAAVCINPAWVSLCAALLQDTATRVCTVVGFPLGATAPDTKHYEARRAILDGAREIDMVVNIGALKSGDHQAVADDMAAVIVPCREAGVVSKVILETALLDDHEKVVAAGLVRDAGADFVKTSTGFGPGGATVADTALLRKTVGAAVGVKASGGIRDLATFTAMLEAGATRIGTSAGAQLVSEAARLQRDAATDGS